MRRLVLVGECSSDEVMMFSFYVAHNLKTWGDSGLKTVKILIAMIEIPLTECQQHYRYMKN